MTGDGWRREAERLAWWAWLVCPDPRLAVRIADYRGATPPWLGTTALFSLGLTVGLLAAMAIFMALPTAPHWRVDALALTLMLHFAGTLLARPEDEPPSDFPRRFAAALLHAPYLWLVMAAWLNLWAAFAEVFGIRVVGGRDGLSPEFGLILIGLGLLLLFDVVTCGPGIYRGPRDKGIAGASFLLRLAAIVSWLVSLVVLQEIAIAPLMRGQSWFTMLFGSYPILPALKTGTVVAVAALVLVRPYEEVCRLIGEYLFAGPSAKSRTWPHWLAPLPLSFERLLLRSDQPSDWSLAVDLAFSSHYPARELLTIGRRAWRRGDATPPQARLATLAAATAWQTGQGQAAEHGWSLLEGVLRTAHEAVDTEFWTWLGSVVRLRRVDLLRWILRSRHDLELPRRDILAILRPLRWTMVLDGLAHDERREMVGQVLDLVGEVARVDLLEQVLRDLDVWRETQPDPNAVVDPYLLARWARAILDAGESAADPVLAHSATLRRTALRAAAGDAGALRTWYALAGRYEDLPPSRRRDVLHPFGYRELWRLVLERHSDGEELVRQDERYQRSVEVRRPSGSFEAPA